MISLIFFFLMLPAVVGAGEEKRVPCSETKPSVVRVPWNRITSVNFPTPPKEAIPGSGGFDIKRVGSDLTIKAVREGANTNLIVYLENRRCFFHLESGAKGDESVFVRDQREKTVEVKYVDQK